MCVEERCSIKLTHKEWRRIAKKERRRRIRRLVAQERDANEERLRAALESNVEYLKFCAEEEKRKEEEESQKQKEHVERERLWEEEEIRAQKKYQVLQEQKAKEEQEKREREMKIREEFEAMHMACLKRKEEEKKKYEEQLRKQEQLEKEIDDYIDNGLKTPEVLREIVDNQPTKTLCPFFTKTGACRYGNACSKNHRRVFLSKVILIPGFYSHFSLEKNVAEYDTDVALEFENSEMLHHFHEFYKDVISELESFGKIKTLKCCCNMEIHLRGNLYIEYYTEREAARAWRNLKGRWYGGKQLNCEFVCIPSWRSAVCGIFNCPKSSKFCNFLHTFKNPNNKYSPIKTRALNDKPQDSSKRSEHRNKSRWEESDRDDEEKDRNWRWSESPETELDRTKDSKTDSTKRKQSQRLPSNKKQRKDVKSSVKSSKKISNKKHHQLKRKKARDNEDQNKEDAFDYHPKKRRKRSRKKKEKNHKKSLEENTKKSDEIRKEETLKEIKNFPKE